MDDLDALLADLETTTSHISKRPVLLTDSGGGLSQDRAPETKPSPPPYNPQQQAGTTNMSVDPLPASSLQGGSDKEHLYSTVCKPRSPKPKEGAPLPFSSSSGVLGAGLCELDRLLQELNATQFNITVRACAAKWLECYTPFVNGSFFEHGGRPFCEIHYHKQRGSLCSGCEKPITGRCITAMARKFHPEHFVCAFCLKQLNKGTFKEQNDKPYCHPCFIKLFG
ncbi:hypothetical protein JRQ81_006059 [Phrynocephalus forsythii]|uniref:LIM zinc-binding domain-containing protein n=1 Tax=Phrynocephalus forsythii TaxID=171643 RepID=A0A9Q0XH09_9SAUR|nr:hypothetical protein JRQ81_006059 [Phrynocephalus forsythii]